MLKKLNKSIGITILLIITMVTIVYSANEDATLKEAENNICTINLGDEGNVVKKLISVDNTNKEVTLQIDVTNLKEKSTEIIPSEIILVIDNSESMERNILNNGTTRKNAVFTAAKTLATNLLNAQSTSKIGIVSFSTNVDPSKEGTLEDAKLIIQPSSNISDITTAIDSIQANGPRTNIEAGLQIALNSFSNYNDYKKSIVLLTDGVPNTAVGGPTMTYSGEVTIKTKAILQLILNSYINIITVMTGVDSNTQPDPNGATSIQAKGKTYQNLAEEIFGTQSNPTYGKFYYVTDENVVNTVITNVYSDVIILKENILKNIILVDYFPDEIIENYNFEIVETANIGTVTSTVNKENNSITWQIKTLQEGETASFKYKLKLKEVYNEKIINVVMPTNKKVDVTYTDTDENQNIKTSTISPKIVLLKDNTIAPTVIPQTGEFIIKMVGLLIVIICVIGYIAYRKYKKGRFFINLKIMFRLIN